MRFRFGKASMKSGRHESDDREPWTGVGGLILYIEIPLERSRIGRAYFSNLIAKALEAMPTGGKKHWPEEGEQLPADRSRRHRPRNSE
jgi:hypothetical protein